MTRWFTDTLAKRLFVLMWVALVLSHVLAYAAVRAIYLGPSGPTQLPTFPSLPPGPGIPQVDQMRPPDPEFRRQGPGGPRGPGPGESGHRGGDSGFDDGAPRDARDPLEPGGPEGPYASMGPRGGGVPRPNPTLPSGALALDYGIRLVIIGLAAAVGARWLSRPVRDLVSASEQLGNAITAGSAPPMLDEQAGVREVRNAASVFNAMARRLRQSFQARGLMIAAISHDLRTPLTRMRMRLEMTPVDELYRERSVADIREMNQLIDSVLDAFRADTDHSDSPLQPVDVGALVSSLVDDLAEQGQAVSASGGGDAVTLAEPNGLRRVVGNLVDNALRYGKTVQVTTTGDDEQVRITVEDDGPGIPEARLEHVVQPFYRLDPSRSRDTGGAGLGLFIAQDLLRRQGGRLDLSNRREGGLRAVVTLAKRASPT